MKLNCCDLPYISRDRRQMLGTENNVAEKQLWRDISEARQTGLEHYELRTFSDLFGKTLRVNVQASTGRTGMFFSLYV